MLTFCEVGEDASVWCMHRYLRDERVAEHFKAKCFVKSPFGFDKTDRSFVTGCFYTENFHMVIFAWACPVASEARFTGQNSLKRRFVLEMKLLAVSCEVSAKFFVATNPTKLMLRRVLSSSSSQQAAGGSA